VTLTYDGVTECSFERSHFLIARQDWKRYQKGVGK
jgi:hypothetical protein